MAFYKFIAMLAIVAFAGINIAIGANTTVNNAEELQAALDNASPGDLIILAPETFNGTFTAAKNGSEEEPIAIMPENENSTVVGSGENGTVGFTISGSYWTIKSIPVTNFDLGVLITGTGNILDAMAICNSTKGVEIQTGFNVLNACAINRVDYGIIVSANNTNLTSNAISETKYSIITDQSTCCGQIKYNTADGIIELNGSEYTLDSNVFKGQMNVSGCENTFQNEVDALPEFLSKCENPDLGGNLFL